MNQTTINTEKITRKQTGERQGQSPEQSRELTNKILNNVTIGLEEVRRLHNLMTATTADIKVDLAEIRADLAKIRADSAAFRAGLTEIETIIQSLKNRDFSHLQESSDN